MPYQIKAVSHDKIYTYQHGIERKSGERAMSIPQYVPLTYFVWGDVWVEQFRTKAHPDSEVYPVGSPRYDNLITKRHTQESDIDLLFISGSHTLTRDDQDEDAYHDLVNMVVSICEELGWKLAIKLHPVEGPERYKQWGYEDYIIEEDSIEKLLLRSDIAVTDLSSAFIESVLLGTPIVVTQTSMNTDLQFFGQMNGLAFPDTLSEARDDIRRLKGSDVLVDEVNRSGLLNLNNSSERIYQMVVEDSEVVNERKMAE
jgi:hypothetical protein